MPSLTVLRDAAVAALAQALPDARRVEAFSGELTLESAALKNLPEGATALVAVLRAENTGSASSLDLDMAALFGVLLITRDRRSPEAREQAALAVTEAAVIAIHGQTFGLANVGPARIVELEPVTDAELAQYGLGVWSLVWRQNLTFNAG